MSKVANLQNALNTSSSKKLPPSNEPPREAASASYKAPSRADHINMSAWLPRDFKKSIRLVQAKKLDNSTIQDLMAEAFNDLFSKYNVPTVNYPAEAE
jgi:hypothetical protein